jgi:SH3-like domain-containing protein
MKRAVITLALLVASPALLPVAAESPADVQISRFSGKPVPRFETLKHEKVNGRVGPSTDHKVRWEYVRKGLPMLVLKESGDWRYVRDPLGDEVWIERSQLASRQTAVAMGDFILKAGRAPDSADVARVAAGAQLDLGSCDATKCHVTADSVQGWAPRAQLWGATATKG